MNLTVKYAIEPVYDINEKEQVKLLYGYIVSKCYEIDSTKGHIVFFPYVINKKTYKLNEKRLPNQISVGFNTNSVDMTFDNYIIAKTNCNKMNRNLHMNKDKFWYISLQKLEDLVSKNTFDMKLNEKERIKIKKSVR